MYNPEDAGLMPWKQMRPDGDFQHLPSWRELVVATALSLRSRPLDRFSGTVPGWWPA